ncbi:MAG: acetoacetate metabolism transcriptional regulator AtoC [Thermodesulfovibrionales bacterium]
MNKILIVDDEEMARSPLCEILAAKGFFPLEATDGRNAVRIFERERPDTVLLDLVMPGMDGIETMRELKKIDPDIPVIIVTAHGDVPTAVEAIKLGAYDFVVKPPDFNRLILTIRRAIEKLETDRRLKKLDAAIQTHFGWMLGRSMAMKEVIEQVNQVAGSDFSVIIQGETGTGKSIIANAIHALSRRSEGPFITVDMGTIPEGLVENELFGHEKGAFTGAGTKKKGFFEIADGGTIFIDELQNMSSYVQGKLLRAVEEKRIYPLGSTRPVDVDVRVLVAINTDIRQAVREKKVREDLFFRLGEFIISLPPLRERVEDIPIFARRFLSEASAELNRQVWEIADDAIELLKRYPWPGNLRELKNAIKRAVLLSNSGMIMAEDINFLVGDRYSGHEPPAMTLKDAEKMAIKRALETTKGNKTKAASVLQIDYKTLLTKIKQYGL